METNAVLLQSRQLRQWNAVWVSRARAVRQESRGLHQHAQALHTRWQHWCQRYLRVECAWCQQLIRWQILPAPVPVPTPSHGICLRCYATVTRELGLRSRRMPMTG
jgi:hypothetical protein